MSRFVILGSSPNRDSTPNLRRLLSESTVVGLNRAPLRGKPLDYWVVWDTHDMADDKDMLHCLTTMTTFTQPKIFFRESGGPVPPYLYITWFDGLPQNSTPTDWALNKLPCRGSVCTTASALAYLLGAIEIWLVGVDFASPGPTPDWTPEVVAQTAKFVNEFYKDFPIPVYKTFNGGPLELEYREYGN